MWHYILFVGLVTAANGQVSERFMKIGKFDHFFVFISVNVLF